MISGSRLLLRLLNTRRCTRRTFLLSALIGLTTGCNRYSLANDEPEPCVKPQWLKAITSQKSAARLGRAYLDEHPQHRQCHTLIANIERTLQRQDTSISPQTDAEQTSAALQRLVRNEYRHDDVVSVSGWVLSKTEARLYALAAMIE